MKPTLFLTVVFSVCLGATLTTTVQAQAKRTQPNSKPVTTQTATTEDGRKVILKSNKTWAYAVGDSSPDEKQEVTRSVSKANSILSIETGLVFKSGDVKPLARTEFHILDDSLANILRNAGLKPPKSYGETGEADRDYVSAFAFASKYSSDPTYQEFYPRAIEALKPHIVQSVTTDFSGKARFG